MYPNHPRGRPKVSTAKTPTATEATPVIATTARSTLASCGTCRELLEQILIHNSSSRPRVLLQSLLNATSTTPLTWRSIPDGVQVEIPRSSESSVGAIRSDETPHMATSSPAPTEQTRQQQPPSSLIPSSSMSSPVDNSSGASEIVKEWLSIVCKKCADTGPERNARAFVTGPVPLSVVICTNRFQASLEQQPQQYYNGDRNKPEQIVMLAKAQEEMEEMLTHELVHVYDIRRLQLDLQQCDQLAYSEIRAAREAECYSTRTMMGQPQLQQHTALPTAGWFRSSATARPNHSQQESCVHQKALAATRNMFGTQQSKVCIERVMESAMKDRRPFTDVSPESSGGPSQTGIKGPPLLSTSARRVKCAKKMCEDDDLPPCSSR